MQFSDTAPSLESDCTSTDRWSYRKILGQLQLHDIEAVKETNEQFRKQRDVESVNEKRRQEQLLLSGLSVHEHS